jgi:hypothetical protein
MSHRRFVPVAASVALVAALSGAVAFTQPAPQAPTLEQIVQMSKQMAPISKQHGRLKVLAGTWDLSFDWNLQPGMPPVTGAGTCTNTWIMGGRFLDSHAITGGDPATAFESRTTYGYDDRPGVGKFFAFGIDVTGNYAINPQGDWDEATKSFILKGDMLDPQTGKTVGYRQVVRIESDDRHVSEFWFPTPNGDFKMVEIRFTRSKPPTS